MRKISKYPLDNDALAQELRERRLKLGYTLEYVQRQIGVDVGQLSKMERGVFVFISKNLQKYIDFLQIEKKQVLLTADELSRRVYKIAAKSERHRAAIQSLLKSIEILG